MWKWKNIGNTSSAITLFKWITELNSKYYNSSNTSCERVQHINKYLFDYSDTYLEENRVNRRSTSETINVNINYKCINILEDSFERCHKCQSLEVYNKNHKYLNFQKYKEIFIGLDFVFT